MLTSRRPARDLPGGRLAGAARDHVPGQEDARRAAADGRPGRRWATRSSTTARRRTCSRRRTRRWRHERRTRVSADPGGGRPGAAGCSCSTARTSAASASASRRCTARRPMPTLSACARRPARNSASTSRSGRPSTRASWSPGSTRPATGRCPVVLNAGALTHYSYALMDAVKMRTAPLVEVHISNIAAREGFRHESVITGAATGIIAGFGFQVLRAGAPRDRRRTGRRPVIVLVGFMGAGKTTVGRLLAAKLGVPVHRQRPRHRGPGGQADPADLRRRRRARLPPAGARGHRGPAGRRGHGARPRRRRRRPRGHPRRPARRAVPGRLPAGQLRRGDAPRRR